MDTKQSILNDLADSVDTSRVTARSLVESALKGSTIEDTADHAHEVLDLINSMKSTHKWLTKQEAQKIGQAHLNQLKTEIANMSGRVDEMLEEFED